jgi:S-(hydroxymethyl)glutathione dehydrogenase / alcohol dehydrogenase
MLAAVCRAFAQPLVIEEVDLAPPGPGEVEVALAACAICHSDLHFIEGAWGGALPAVYGHEAAGKVVRLGEGVLDLRPGDHVVVTLIRSCKHCYYCGRGEETACDHAFALAARSPLTDRQGIGLQQGMGTGAFAERVVVDRSQLVAIDKDVPFAAAALLACGVITGVGAVTNTAAVPPGASVVVIGAGGVGLNTVQGARLAGAGPIIAIDLVAEKRATALAFGATDALDPLGQSPADAVRGLTGGRGADYVFVAVGAKAAIEQGLGLLRRGGSLVIVGMPASGVTIALDPTRLAAAGQRVIGSKMGSSRIATDIPKLVEWYRQGHLKLDELVSGRYPLVSINEAISDVRRGTALRNVIVF